MVATPSTRLYRRIAGIFLLLTAMMLSVVLYLATVRADIRIETLEGVVETEFFVSVLEQPQANTDVPGEIVSETLERSKVFEVDGEGEEIPSKAHGLVTLHNEGNADQPLVATTRLLTEDGALFRMVEAATVPANGTVQVEARAHEAGKQGEIGPSRFTIPGLNPTKQKVIYATSDQAMIGGTERRAVVTEVMLEDAHTALLKDVETELDAKWREGLSPALDGVMILQETLEKRTDTEPGTEAGTFAVTTIVKNTGVYFDRARLQRIAEAKLQEHVPEGQVLREAHLAEMVVTIDTANVEGGTARLHVSVDGTAVLKATSDVLDRENLMGLSAGDAEMLLENQPTIQNATIDLSPFWVRRIPRLRDHIFVEIVDVAEGD